jgi:hypothetical protein
VWALVGRSAEGDTALCRLLLRSIAKREARLGNITLPDHWDITDIQWAPDHWEAFIRDRVAVAGTICGASQPD